MIVKIVCFTSNGGLVANKIKDLLTEDSVSVFSKTSSIVENTEKMDCSLSEWTESNFGSDALIFVGATGIAVRAIAPYIKSKTTDPAVVCVDESGKFSISLLSGHIGGCNTLAERIAKGINAIPVVTTATDLNKKFAVDSYASENYMQISDMTLAKETSARILDGRFIGLKSDFPIEGEIPDGLILADSGDFGIYITDSKNKTPFEKTLRLTPMTNSLGVGCRRDKPFEDVFRVVSETLDSNDISEFSINTIASITLKADEPAILELSDVLGAPVVFYTAERLNSVEGDFSSSDMVKNVTGVDCVCERSAVAASKGKLKVKKTAKDGVTVAVAQKDFTVKFRGN